MGFLDGILGGNKMDSIENTEITETSDMNEPIKFVIDEVYKVEGIPVVAGRVLSGIITKDCIAVIKGKSIGIGKIQIGKQNAKEIHKGESGAMILTRVNFHELKENTILNFSR